MEITLSINKGYIDKDLTKIGYGWNNETLSIQTLSEYISKGIGYSAGVIKSEINTNKAPSKSDIDRAEILIIDIDNDTEHYISIESFIENNYIKKYGAILHETIRSTNEKNRFRVIFILNEPVNSNDYEKLADYFSKIYNSDINCKNINKNYAGSSKSTPIILGCKKVNVKAILELCKVEEKNKIEYDYEKTEITTQEASDMLRHIPVKTDFETWRNICYDVFNYFGESVGANLIQSWSPYLNNFGKDETHKWAKTHKITGVDFPKTLYYFAKKYGWEDKRFTQIKTNTKALNKKESNSKEKKTSREKKNLLIKTIEDYLMNFGNFKINLLTRNLELHNKNEIKQVTDYEVNSIWRDMTHKGLYTLQSPSLIDQVLNSDFVPTYDPFYDYFNNLPKWNEIDQFEIIVNSLNLPAEINYISKDYLKHWFVGVVAQALNVGQNHLCLVLYGEQGIGKNSIMRMFMPSTLKNYFIEKAINTDNPDDKILTTKMLFIMMDELEGVTKRDTHGLKSIMTQQQFNIRLPYARRHNDFTRRASFCAGVNKQEFLNDITGNRRFLVIPIDKHIDFNKLEFLEIDQLYSQCMHLLNTGFKYWYDGAEIKELNERNLQFSVPSTEQEFIQKYFIPGDKEDSLSEFMTTTEIINHIKTLTKENLYANVVGRALNNLGFVKVGQKQKYGYYVKKINQLYGFPN